MHIIRGESDFSARGSPLLYLSRGRALELLTSAPQRNCLGAEAPGMMIGVF